MQSLPSRSLPGIDSVAVSAPHEKPALSTSRKSGSVPGSHDRRHSSRFPFPFSALRPLRSGEPEERAQPCSDFLATYSSWLAVCWTVNHRGLFLCIRWSVCMRVRLNPFSSEHMPVIDTVHMEIDVFERPILSK